MNAHLPVTRAVTRCLLVLLRVIQLEQPCQVLGKTQNRLSSVLTLNQVPKLHGVVLADGHGHLAGGVDAEVGDGVLVPAQDVDTLPVIHSPDAQSEVLICFKRLLVREDIKENTVNKKSLPPMR